MKRRTLFAWDRQEQISDKSEGSFVCKRDFNEIDYSPRLNARHVSDVKGKRVSGPPVNLK
jgi:hypothetical protein